VLKLAKVFMMRSMIVFLCTDFSPLHVFVQRFNKRKGVLGVRDPRQGHTFSSGAMKTA